MLKYTRRDALKTAAGAIAYSAFAGMKSAVAQEADPYADAVLVDGEPAPLADGAFSIIVLPDTQVYSRFHPENYTAQTEWIVAQQEARNIAGVFHLGDITSRATPREWENAQRSMNLLDGKIPYFMVPGNHDYSDQGRCVDRTTLMNDYFPVSKFQDLKSFGGTYDKEPERIENTFHQLDVGEQRFLILCLEYGPRHDVVRWANEVVEANADRQVILITHAYMYYDDTRYDWKKYKSQQKWNPHAYPIAAATNDDVMDGEELWKNLVSRHSNFIMTFNGHVLDDGLGRLTSQSPHGNDVHQMLVNFQMRPQGGEGWLRILEFQPSKQVVEVCDYSPIRKQRNESEQNKFQLSWSALLQQK